MGQRENGCRCSDKETKNEKRRVYVEKRKMYKRAVTRAKLRESLKRADN